jgi:hypothetical protein
MQRAGKAALAVEATSLKRVNWTSLDAPVASFRARMDVQYAVRRKFGGSDYRSESNTRPELGSDEQVVPTNGA